HQGVGDEPGAAVADGEVAGHPEPDDVVLQVHPVEGGDNAARSDRLNQETAGSRIAAVVVDERVGHEQLADARDRAVDDTPSVLPFEVPDHAVLDVHGRGESGQYTTRSEATPVDDQAAQADDVAAAGIDVEDDGTGTSERSAEDRLPPAVARDGDGFADGDRFPDQG